MKKILQALVILAMLGSALAVPTTDAPKPKPQMGWECMFYPCTDR